MIWRPLDREDKAQAEYEVFLVADPCHLDILTVTGKSLQCRHHIKQWTPDLADVEDCIPLTDGRPLVVKEWLGSSKVPVLCLLDE